ncbi:MAG: hypothetical protein LRS48_06800 [Desulfurococcales archaeon]|nr:hypothetical protein [Desulfurococcales archaeon]
MEKSTTPETGRDTVKLAVIRYDIAAFIIGSVIGSLYAILSFMGGFRGLTLLESGLVGVAGDVLITFLLLPLVEYKYGPLQLKGRIEVILVSLLTCLTFWPVVYSLLV